MCTHIWVHVYIPWCMCRGKQTTYKCRSSPSIMQDSDIKLSSSDLATIALTGSAIQCAFFSVILLMVVKKKPYLESAIFIPYSHSAHVEQIHNIPFN